MGAPRMHVDEVDIDEKLVQHLLRTQFPHWADLPLEKVHSAGTDNALYRLGADLSARLPRIPAAVPQVAKEHQWLPRLAGQLPLAIPAPRGLGRPDDRYPWPWSVYGWLSGESAAERPVDLQHAAIDLARFLGALQRIDPAGAPAPGIANFHRGVPLVARDRHTQDAIAQCAGRLDTKAATEIWQRALAAPEYTGSPVWIHGDLHPMNLLVEADRLSAVIDFGALAAGDPACDLMIAWTLLDAPSRALFRNALDIDADSWARGRGWALSVGVIALPYYAESNPALAAVAQRGVDEVLADARLD